MLKNPRIIAGIAASVLLVGILGFVFLQTGDGRYALKTVAPFDASIEAPALPDITGFTTEAVKAMLPKVNATEGQVEVKKMETSKFFDFMAMNVLIPDFAEQQERDDPVSIEIVKGVYDLAAIAKAVNDPQMIEKTPEGWLLKVPVIVQAEGTLVITGQDNAVRMSAGKGVFISNFGKLYTVDTTITGWVEETESPATFEESDIFRPYLVFWSGSHTWLASSKFLNLGYNFPKSYGVTFSTSAKMLRDDTEIPRPTGWLVDSFFKDIYYGFYSYEADDVAIVRNVYEDNVIYGIDPHDDSRRLIIAENKSYGAGKKHGIIVSREVNDSWIFNNHSYKNNGSGIMIERNSRNNVIANNLSENNGGDGMAFFESSDNLSWNNKYLNNGKSGIRIRNSANITIRGDQISNNGAYGIDAYAASLTGQEDRDMEKDPYEKIVTIDIAGVLLDGNKSGHIQVADVSRLSMSDIRMLNSLKYFKGDLEKHEGDLCAGATIKNSAIIAEKSGLFNP